MRVEKTSACFAYQSSFLNHPFVTRDWLCVVLCGAITFSPHPRLAHANSHERLRDFCWRPNNKMNTENTIDYLKLFMILLA